MKHGDQIEQLAGAQRIVHEVHLLAGPDHHIAPAEFFRHFRSRQHRAVGDVAGGFGLAVADHDLPDRRPQPVGADQGGPAVVLAARGGRDNAVARLRDGDHFLRGA
jgi:hypothetical protein